MKIIDTHTHLNAEQFLLDRDAVIKRSKEKGVTALFNNADSLDSFSLILSLQDQYPQYCFAVLGLHPEFALESDEYKENAFKIIKEKKDEIKAIGEIGLDYHYDHSPEVKEKQKELFRKQLDLAEELNLPVVIHSRDADYDTFAILKEKRPRSFDLHCYSSSLEMLEMYLKEDLNIHIGIGGVVTFKNAKEIVKVVKSAPLNCLLSETDAPYLAPTGHRGERNESSYLPLIIERIAEIRGEEIEPTAEAIYQNGRAFYGI